MTNAQRTRSVGFSPKFAPILEAGVRDYLRGEPHRTEPHWDEGMQRTYENMRLQAAAADAAGLFDELREAHAQWDLQRCIELFREANLTVGSPLPDTKR